MKLANKELKRLLKIEQDKHKQRWAAEVQSVDGNHRSTITALEGELTSKEDALSKARLQAKKDREMALKEAKDAKQYKDDAIAYRVINVSAFKGDKSDLQLADERIARLVKMVAARDVSKAEKDSVIRKLQNELTEVGKMTRTLNEMLTGERAQAMEQSIELKASNAKVITLETKCADYYSKSSRANGKLGGRPTISRTDDDLNELNPHTKREWTSRATERVLDVIGEAGEDTEMSLEVLMDSLKLGGYLNSVWASEEMWEYKMAWVAELRGDLHFVWDAELTRRLRDKLNLSYDEVDELRFAFSHNRVGKQLRPRPWVINPHTNKRIAFPTPLANRHQWTPLIKQFIDDHHLSRDADGRIAQRPYAAVLREQVRRDVERGWVKLSDITEEEPLHPTLGADGTAVGKVGFMHVSSDISANYLPGIAKQNEVNLSTIAAAQTDDHWGGLNEVLCGGFYTGKVIPKSALPSPPLPMVRECV